MNDLLSTVKQLDLKNIVLVIGSKFHDVLETPLAEATFAQLLAKRSEICKDCPISNYGFDDCSIGSRCQHSLAKVSSVFEARFGRPNLLSFIINEIHKVKQPLLIHKLISQLKIKTIITYCYDELLEDALTTNSRTFNKVVRDYDLPYRDEDELQLIKIKGCISDVDSMVITEEDQDEFIQRLPLMSIDLQYNLAGKDVIYLGHNPEESIFKGLHQYIVKQLGKHARRHLLVTEEKISDSQKMILEKRGIEIIKSSLTTFVESLLTNSSKIQSTEKLGLDKELPDRPYKFLDYFDTEDAAIFFGRNNELALLKRHIVSKPVFVLFGQSGVGKTSIIRAGLIPQLHSSSFTCLYIRAIEDPTSALKKILRDVHNDKSLIEAGTVELGELFQSNRSYVIFIDQFEELFIKYARDMQIEFLQKILKCVHDPQLSVRVVISIREDFFVELDQISNLLPTIFENRFRLRNLDEEKARIAIIEPATLFGINFDVELVNQIISDLRQDREGFEPPQLQIVCDTLYDQLTPASRVINVALYEKLGRSKKILAEYLDRALLKLELGQRTQSQIILKAMVTSLDTKTAVTMDEILRDELVQRAQISQSDILEIINHLYSMRIIRKLEDNSRIELAHDYLANKVREWITDEERALKATKDLIRRELQSYRQHQLLMGRDSLDVVLKEWEKLFLNDEESEFVIRSVLNSNLPLDPWFKKFSDQPQTEHLENTLTEELSSSNELTKHRAVVSIARLGSPSLFERMTNIVLSNETISLYALEAILRMERPYASQYLTENCPGDMILIPAGSFIAGDNHSKYGSSFEYWLPSFYIDRTPVTCNAYLEFILDDGYKKREFWSDDGWTWIRTRGLVAPEHFEKPHFRIDGQPILSITWFEASAFAKWSGKRLPTEMEWEKAARGADGRKFPWGNDESPEKANVLEQDLNWPTRVGSYSPIGDSPYGVVDMCGNVCEWTSSLYRPFPYEANDGREDSNLQGDRVIRGGAWNVPLQQATCFARDHDPLVPFNHPFAVMGFRCATSFPKSYTAKQDGRFLKE